MSDETLLGLPERHWLRLALAFNFQPAGYLHDSWFDHLPQGELIRRLRDEPASAVPINRHLRQILTLDRDSLMQDFSARRSRLALLDGAALMRLSWYAGLALRSHALRSELLGTRLRRLRQALGEEAFTFAVKRAPFLGTIPDFPFEPETDDPQTRFLVIGARYCVLQVAELDGKLARRMVLKLPRDWADWIDPQDDTGTRLPDKAANEHQDNSGLTPLLRKLIKERLPRWTPLFA